MKELTCAVCKKPADYILHNKYGQPLNICESCYKYLWGPMPLGKWIFHKDYNESCRYSCNLCGNLNNISSNFCPNCGARMVKNETD